MKTSIAFVILLGTLAGCAAPREPLASLDVDGIIRVAQREIQKKCPEFDMNDWEPMWIQHHVAIGSDMDENIAFA